MNTTPAVGGHELVLLLLQMSQLASILHSAELEDQELEREQQVYKQVIM